MAENSGIEWTDHTFNPWIGCSKVAAGCTHCYAETLMDTRYGRVQWGENGTRVKTSPANWSKPRAWNRAAQKAGKPALVFCASLADVGEDRPELVPWRAELCDLIRECDWLTFQLLTKRPENLTRLFPSDVLERCWVGASVAEQKDAAKNIPILLQVPSAIRFVSAEPLIGPVDLREVPLDDDPEGTGLMEAFATALLNDRRFWLILGCESGPNARGWDTYEKSARALIEQCRAAGVATFHKQMPINGRLSKDPAEWPEWARVREYPTVEAK